MKNNAKKTERISIIVPVYNELKNIEKLITRLSEAMLETDTSFEIIFVDDNSTDGTYEYLTRYKNSARIRIFSKIGKKGKAYSLIQGFTHATGTILVMIDADLQYAPEAIPAMIKKLAQGADIVVGNRKKFQASKIRSLMSNTFRIVFGKMLFDLPHDVQSGLKAFKKEVWDTVHFTPKSGWSFDLEFLHRAKEAGFIIQNNAIEFLPRRNGNSKISVVKTSLELAASSLRLKLTKNYPQSIPTNGESQMIGAGIGYKRKKYITHTTMPHNQTAMTTFTNSQKIVIVLVVLDILLGFVTYPLITLQVVVGLLSLIYFIDVLFNLLVVTRSVTSESQISFSEKKLASIDEKTLPTYSILCPLYREAHVVPQFLEAIKQLDWPKNKLDVMLLLEEDDKETVVQINEMPLPSYVRIVVVPHSIPKTKPKACNYGLSLATGEYLVIYDAEDIPEPLQLKKAYLGFQQVTADVICLQAKLNYYNPHQNLLTRFFTTEYSLWFDVTLTGLQSINTVIPLGGTSNHFRTRQLQKVEGWDPFNVTEDADLGMRLFKKGYRTAIIDSVTLEEANSKFGNWIRQRSRWIKGYMQTYLVHVRESLGYTKGKALHALIFHLVIGGKIMFIFLNPFLWITTIAYFSLYAYVGPSIEKLYPPLVFYMAAISLVFGNFLALFYYMIGIAKKEKWDLMKFVFLLPLYWLMTSIAGFVGLYQLIFKPHYWEKTVHGLHLKKKAEKVIASAVVAVESDQVISSPNKWREKLAFALNKKALAGSFFIASIGVSSLVNLLFSSYLWRALSLEDFALVNLFGSLFALSGIISGALGKTVIHKSGFLTGKKGDIAAYLFWKQIRKNAIVISITLGILWLALSPVSVAYLRLDNAMPILVFLPIVLLGLLFAVDNGYLASKLRFGSIAAVVMVEAMVKLGFAGLLVFLGHEYWTFSAIPVSFIAAFLFLLAITTKERRGKKEIQDQAITTFPKKFFAASLVTGLSTIVFVSLDVVLAKHYLAPSDAGLYDVASLVCKMVFFLGSFISPFIIPLVSRNEGANKSSQNILSVTLLATMAFSLVGFLAFGVFGHITAPIIFGSKVIPVLPYLLPMCFAMVCFSLSRVFTEYYLAKKYYTFSVAIFLLACAQFIVLSQTHTTVASFVNVMSAIWVAHLVLTFTLHAFSRQVKTIENNVVDFLGLFAHIAQPKKQQNDNVSILIFNWRDTKHKWAGGAEVYVHEIARRWVKEGHRVTVFCGNDYHSLKNEIIDGVQIYRRGGFYMVYIWAFLYYICKFYGRYDVIIDSENGIPFFTPLYAKERKFLLIHHVHQEVFRKNLKWPFSSLALFLEAKFMPFVYRNVQVITVSPSSRNEILKHNLTKTDPIIVYNGVDLEKFVPGKKSDKPLILYLGRLQYYKSLNVFILAAKKIIAQLPDAEFVIAGEGEHRAKLQEYAQKLDIDKKITFVGRVSHEEKIKLFQKAWVFVNPSFMEGWGLTAIEAAACGVPVVASDVPGLRDSIRDNITGFLVKYGDADRFADMIIELVTNDRLRENMGKESISWANYFSWAKSANQFKNLLQKNVSYKEARFSRSISIAK